METVEEMASKVLGKKINSDYLDCYTPEVLVSIPRNLSIEHTGTTMEELEGGGFDTWYCYEFSFLTGTGVPLCGVLKFVFYHNNLNIIESKSLKLYLNSFAMYRINNTKEPWNVVLKTIKEDLENLTKGIVEVEKVARKVPLYKDEFIELEYTGQSVKQYQENPKLLKIRGENSYRNFYFYKFSALRSGCRITHQPDTGAMYIYYSSKREVDRNSLFEYLASFRSEYHFHEEILISCFSNISKILEPEDELMCCALYNRRGSLDIAPCRYKNITSQIAIDFIRKLSDKEAFSSDYNNLSR